MSAKFAYSLSDEHPDIRKQMGCMNGIFQIFERGHFLSGSRRYNGLHQKRLPPPDDSGLIVTESKRATTRQLERDNKKGTKEKHRVSTESSRTSFSSSSCSSSLSSLESTRASQMEPSSCSQSITMESHQRELPTVLSSWQSSDFRGLVKDSIYRETREISVKTATRREAGGQKLTYIDSPRPVRRQKSMEQKSSGLRESTQVLHQPRDTARTSIAGTHNATPKDVRRLSLDGRELRDNNKSAMKIKELPRFSLDSRAGSVKGSTAEMRRSYPTQETERCENSAEFLNQREPGSNRRPSSVVAKLMGLEALPELITTNSNQAREFIAHFGLQNDALSRSSRTTNEHYQNQNASSPASLNRELSSPRPVTEDSIKKRPEKSKSSIEPTPWNRLEASQGSPSPRFANQAAPAKGQNLSASVYGEIEKRFANLEFKRSGKDLRALKQILEAMQKSQATFETKSDASEWLSHPSRYGCLELSVENQQRSTICSSPARGAESSTSPIVIIKPAKLTGQASYPASSANHTNDQLLNRTRTAEYTGSRKKSNNNLTATRDPTLKTNDLAHRNSHPTRLGDRSARSRPTKPPSTRKEPLSPKKESTIMERNIETMNSKNKKKIFDVEKKSRPTTPTDSKKSSKQLTPTGLSRRKPGPKSPSMQMEADLNHEVRDLSQPENSISQQSESNASMASQINEEVSSLHEAEKIKAVLQHRPERQKEPAEKSTVDNFDADLSLLSEQPSPVSVLEAKFYNDELPSPIKKISTCFKVVDTDDEMGWENTNTCKSLRIMVPESSVPDHMKVEDIKTLIQLLKQISSAKETIPNELAPYNHSSSEHQYVLEIVLASNFLRDFESIYEDIQHNPTAHPIKPGFFLDLEEALGKTDGVDEEHPTHSKLAKTQRKLLFDITNDFLQQKLVPENSAIIWNAQSTPTQRVPKGLPLCLELLSELDKLKGSLWEDMMHQSANWTSGLTETSGLVLDLERMIFKDLVTEVVSGEMNRQQMGSAAYCRQLYS